MALRELRGAPAPERDRISAAPQWPAVPGAAVARRRGTTVREPRPRLGAVVRLGARGGGNAEGATRLSGPLCGEPVRPG